MPLGRITAGKSGTDVGRSGCRCLSQKLEKWTRCRPTPIIWSHSRPVG